MKRLFDVTIATTLLVVLSPVIGVLSLKIKKQMGAPVLFKQQRPGLHEKPFYLCKFRTMGHGTDVNGELLPDHSRLTELGKFLRKYSLDELPQLLNVFKGEMSLVGPRPLLMDYLPLYSDDQKMRHHVKPGMTGWAQVNGRNAISWEEKFKLDTWYVQNQSFLLDLKILCITIYKVLKKEGINQQEEVPMEKFRGSKEVI
ncbi:sugar transferase [Pseudalkalibacillus hwajinpoensis]|uniref:sugar transferase n=1 Tax=Guptibacillus hwajinpoensis TaxID=208199 RepID=UPI00325C2C89